MIFYALRLYLFFYHESYLLHAHDSGNNKISKQGVFVK
jgi:hypothetical protein